MKQPKLYFFLLLNLLCLNSLNAQEAIFGAEQTFYKNLVSQPESVFAADLDGDVKIREIHKFLI